MPEENMEIGHYVREWRNFRGLSQSKLARAVGVSPAAICVLEQGKSGYHQQTLVRIAAALGVSPSDLIGMNPLSIKNTTEHDYSWIQRRIGSMSPAAKRMAMKLVDDVYRYDIEMSEETELDAPSPSM